MKKKNSSLIEFFLLIFPFFFSRDKDKRRRKQKEKKSEIVCVFSLTFTNFFGQTIVEIVQSFFKKNFIFFCLLIFRTKRKKEKTERGRRKTQKNVFGRFFLCFFSFTFIIKNPREKTRSTNLYMFKENEGGESRENLFE